MKETLKEYFILLICSCLSLGPRVRKVGGFDLIIYNNSIEMSMEYCGKTDEILDEHKTKLKRKLHFLHQFNIVHLDIKPSNIAFSKRLNSFVFLDFGLSKMIK